MKTDIYLTAWDLKQFRVPAIRHLAWMCQTAQLSDSPLAFDLRSELALGTLETLQGWDSMPDTAPAALLEPAHRRLGYYFERLYECLLCDLLGWEVLARNVPIRGLTRTLGELDFILRNPHTGSVEHHEIAVKFYLGHMDPSDNDAPPQVRWYGPNAVDRLDLKTSRMLEQQSQRTLLAESVAALDLLGIEAPVKLRIFMPGYLFYSEANSVTPPVGVPQDHQRGRWAYLESVRAMDTTCWVHLRKPHWLGPWVQSATPDPHDALATLEQIALTQTPRLFASMQWDASTALWLEQERLFIVPAKWPY
jgi:hypothetical protein